MSRSYASIQPKEKRIKNFSEVSCGLTKKQAIDEAIRCPQCASPTCKKVCPLGIDIPGFIRRIREGSPTAALERITQSNHFPGICGRVCPAPCEKACILNEEGSEPISIRELERYASDNGSRKPQKKTKKGHKVEKVAVIGSGPSGLVCASDLSMDGYHVTVFEALHLPGGILRYGIPEFRLSKKILDKGIAYAQSSGIEIKTNVLIGRTFTIEELFGEGFSAIYISAGAGVPKFSDIKGQNSSGVHFCDEYLMQVNFTGKRISEYTLPLTLGGKVVVIGNGDAAFDCARSSIRLGMEASVIYLGTEDELNVAEELKEQSKEEGVKLEILTKPIEIVSDEDGFVQGLRCIKMDFADPERSGQWRLIPVKGSEFTIEANTIVIKAEHKPNSLLCELTKNLRMGKNGSIWVSRNSHETSMQGIFAGGDCVTGPSSMVRAMGEGKKAAQEINEYISK